MRANLSFKACFCGGTAEKMKPIPRVKILTILARFLFKAIGKVTGFSYWSTTAISKINFPIEPCQAVLSQIELYKTYSGIKIIKAI